MSSDVENRIHFGIPIFEYRLAAFEQYQSLLIDYILNIRQRHPGVGRSNQGGWHSNDELHGDQNPAIQWLMQQLYTVGSQCIRHHEQNDAIADIHMVNCWANINEKGDWNAPHHHAPQDWSGVAYIRSAGTGERKPKIIQDGDIVFFDPVGPNWLSHRQPTVNYPAEDGKVLIFPAYLLHMVAPHAGDVPRISVAFNFKIKFRE